MNVDLSSKIDKYTKKLLYATSQTKINLYNSKLKHYTNMKGGNGKTENKDGNGEIENKDANGETEDKGKNFHIDMDKLFEYKHINETYVDEKKKYEGINRELRDSIIKDPKNKYIEMAKKIKENGLNCSFPEFESVVLYLQLQIKKNLYDADISGDKNFDSIKILAEIKLTNIANILYHKLTYLPYNETIKCIYDCLDFFEVTERLKDKNVGTYYHSLNYQYYLPVMIADILSGRHNIIPIIFPVITQPGSTDFIKVCSIPIYFCGVNIENSYVDEYPQSPREFFIHDLNHSRRMYKNLMENVYKVTTKNILESSNDKEMNIIDESINFKNKIINLIAIKQGDNNTSKGIKQLMKMIIFEIVHEDALYLLPDVIWNACHRGDDYIYVFEETINNKKQLDVRDKPIEVEGALAYTKFKLQHQFYDKDGTEKKIVLPEFRYAKYIAIATLILLRKLFPDRYDEEYFKKNIPTPDFKADQGTFFKIQSYNYYLNRTCRNEKIPEPAKSFKFGNNTREDNLDESCLKTGLAQNSWKLGHRRVVGEHLGSNVRPSTTPIKEDYNEASHTTDINEYYTIYNDYFKDVVI